jgi:alpha-tubulin suppressor-like RCC1 family protein
LLRIWHKADRASGVFKYLFQEFGMTRLLQRFASICSLALATAVAVPSATAAITVTPVVEAGSAHSIALKFDGTVWTWGSNAYGQLGNGNNTDSSTPVQVKSLANVVAIAAGFYHNVAVKSDGTVWAWGNNADGQLGIGSTTNSNVPVQMITAVGPPVVNVANAVAVAAGLNHSLVLTTGGILAAGDNTFGQLGTGNNTTSHVAVVTTTAGIPASISAIAAGRNHSLALTSAGTVWAWGDDSVGQLGDGGAVAQNAPVATLTLTNITQISTRDSASLALQSGGVVFGWGANESGQLAQGNVNTPVNPAQPALISNFTVTSIASGAFHSLAIANAGQVIGWGTSTTGQLSNIPPQTYTQATGLASAGGVVQLAAGIAHSLGYKPDGTVIAFGNNSTGQLGNNTKINQLIPVTVVGQGGSGFLNLLGLANLSVSVAGSGTVTTVPAGIVCSGGTCVGAFSQGTQVTLTATAGSGNIFEGWSGGACSGSQSTCVVTINGAEPVTATFSGNTVTGPVTGVVPATGWWWNPAEPGRGFMIEVQNGQLFMATFLYSFSGEATWFGSGPSGYGSGVYAGVLNLYGGGQTLTGAYTPATLVGGSFGTITIDFSSATTGSITWPEGTIPIERFDIVPGGSTATIPSGTPQAGWWWNANEPGRGFSLEIQNGNILIAGYMYDANGNPIWYSSQGPMTGTSSYQGNWIQYGYGQTLTGSFQSASVVNANVGALTIQFSSPTAGMMTLPDGRQIPFIRFLF